MLIEAGLPETPPIAKEETIGKKCGTGAPSVTYFVVAILITFSAVVTGWRVGRAILPAS